MRENSLIVNNVLLLSLLKIEAKPVIYCFALPVGRAIIFQSHMV